MLVVAVDCALEVAWQFDRCEIKQGWQYALCSVKQQMDHSFWSPLIMWHTNSYLRADHFTLHRSLVLSVTHTICEVPKTTLSAILSVTNFWLSCSILIVKHGKVSPTLNVNPILFVIPCKKIWGIGDVQWCNSCHWPRDISCKF